VGPQGKTAFRWAEEPALEPVLRWLRIRKIVPYVKERKGCSLLDIGCGPRFTMLRALSPYIGLGVGIDEEVEDLEYGNIRTYRLRLGKTLPFTDSLFQVVTMLAILEHLDFPEQILKEARRVLRPGGIVLITTPSPKAKPVLEFLSFKLHLVSKKEIQNHKRYYDRRALEELTDVCGLRLEKHLYFQFGFNNFLVATA
jgi:ubiquinone/menaquinone biosynthesis C-methylase UbiE